MRAIVTGVSGQDGYYMTRLLLAQGYSVVGLSRNVVRASAEFGDRPRGLELLQFEPERRGFFSDVVREIAPTHIFNFAALATGAGMFDDPVEMTRVNASLVVDILEAIRHSGRSESISFCQASSSEMFGDVIETPQSEETPFRPKSPYGAAKLYAHNMVGIYRAAYGLRCCSAILYNHESVRRTDKFVTKKVARGAAEIKLGLRSELSMGDLSTSRDWGYAPEFMEALHAMSCNKVSNDYVVATGKLTTLHRLCEIAFRYLGLDYCSYVSAGVEDLRRSSSIDLCGNPKKIENDLGWRARRSIEEIMVEMVDFELFGLGRA